MMAQPEVIHHHVKCITLDRSVLRRKCHWAWFTETRHWYKIKSKKYTAGSRKEFLAFKKFQKLYLIWLDIFIKLRKVKHYFLMTRSLNISKQFNELLRIWYAFKNGFHRRNIILLEYQRKILPIKNVIEWQVTVLWQNYCRQKHQLEAKAGI